MTAHRVQLLERAGDLPRRFLVTCDSRDAGALTVTGFDPNDALATLGAPRAIASAIAFRVERREDIIELIALRRALRAAGVPDALVVLCHASDAIAECSDHCDAVLLADDDYVLPLLAAYTSGVPYGTAAHLLLSGLRDRWDSLAVRIIALAVGSRFSIGCVKAAVPFLGMSRWTLRRRLRELGIMHADAVFGAAVAGIATLLASSRESAAPGLAARVLRRDRRSVARQCERLWRTHGPPRVGGDGFVPDLATASSHVASACDRLVRLASRQSPPLS